MGRLVFELPNGSIDLPTSAELVSTLVPEKASSLLRCVALNGCETFEIGVEIVRVMPRLAVVCLSSLAEDAAARAFARVFYDAVGTFLLARERINVQ